MKGLYNCLVATRLISKSQHVELNFSENLSIKVHVAICKYCKSFQRDIDLVKIELEKIDSLQPQYLNKSFKKKLSEKLLLKLNRNQDQ